ncbi:MAG: cadherin domain-containing protein [Fibrobacterales bacterium]
MINSCLFENSKENTRTYTINIENANNLPIDSIQVYHVNAATLDTNTFIYYADHWQSDPLYILLNIQIESKNNAPHTLEYKVYSYSIPIISNQRQFQITDKNFAPLNNPNASLLKIVSEFHNEINGNKDIDTGLVFNEYIVHSLINNEINDVEHFYSIYSSSKYANHQKIQFLLQQESETDNILSMLVLLSQQQGKHPSSSSNATADSSAHTLMQSSNHIAISSSSSSSSTLSFSSTDLPKGQPKDHILSSSQAIIINSSNNSSISNPISSTVIASSSISSSSSSSSLNNAPTVTAFSVTINNLTPTGSVIGKVHAIDIDQDSISYFLESVDGPFAINKLGQIYTTESVLEKNEYKFIIVVEDSNKARSTSNARITIYHTNQSPQITTDTLSLKENSEIGTTIGTIVAIDPEGGNLTFSVPQPIDQIIITNDGTVIANSVFNYEELTQFSFQVTVYDEKGATSMKSITISIENVNEPPVAYDKFLTLNENEPIGTIIGQIYAVDPDSDELEYYGQDFYREFTVNNDGEIITVGSFNYEANSALREFNVLIEDGQGLSKTISVTVQLNDINETPEFAALSPVSINENEYIYDTIATVYASDPDASQQIDFSLIGSLADGFTIDQTSGNIILTKRLDFEIASKHYVTVQASDGVLMDTIQIEVDVLDVNDFVDIRDSSQYTWTTIGSQKWMSENLRYSSVDSFSCPNDQPKNCDKHGMLYSGNIIMNGSPTDTSNPGTTTGICPNNWHVPTKSEWNEMILFVNTDSNLPSGITLKSTNGWEEGLNGQDLYGFNAFPVGDCYSGGVCWSFGYSAYYWTATHDESRENGIQNHVFYFYYNLDNIKAFSQIRPAGMALRCIEN